MTEEEKIKILRTLSDIEDIFVCEPYSDDATVWRLLDLLRRQIEAADGRAV